MENNGFVQQRPMLSFGQAVNRVLNKYASLSGRARRSEYWWFMVFNWIVLFVAIFLDNMFGINFGYLPYGPLYTLAGLGLIIPNFTVCVRRLHDIVRSGWNILWSLIPIVGGILLLVWLCSDSQRESNRFGESPKYA